MKKNDFYVHIFLLVCIGVLIFAFLFLLNELKGLRQNVDQAKKETIIQQVISKITSTPDSKPTPLSTSAGNKSVVKKDAKKITYINLTGSMNTTNTDWVDVNGSDVLVDQASDYGENAYVNFEAILGVKSDGNKAFVRLYDVTHNIVVNGSEMSTDSTSNGVLTSERLFFWRGVNVYRVQIKSLNGQEVEFKNGRIKIIY